MESRPRYSPPATLTGSHRPCPASHRAGQPGNRFEALGGDRAGQYSIRINDRWRICFEWPDGAAGPVNVEIMDYH